MFSVPFHKYAFMPESSAGRDARTGESANVIELSADDLPAVCPHPSMPLWAWHPRIFLDVVNHNEEACPYCGTRYRPRAGTRIHDHEFGARNLHQHRERNDG
jgi:uncharacterized Zn-finger protein